MELPDLKRRRPAYRGVKQWLNSFGVPDTYCLNLAKGAKVARNVLKLKNRLEPVSGSRFDLSDSPRVSPRVDGQQIQRQDDGVVFSEQPRRRTVALTEFDRNLLKRCLAEESEAWKDFVDRFIGLFVHVIHHTAHARSVQVTVDDVDDLCAEIFVTLLADNFAVLRRFRGSSSLMTYLTVVARRIVVREISRRKMAEALGHVAAHHSSVEQAQATVNWDVQRVENTEHVERMLEGLPPRDADIVREYHLEGRSYREISTRLGVPENSIGPTLSRARDRMRETVRD